MRRGIDPGTRLAQWHGAARPLGRHVHQPGRLKAAAKMQKRANQAGQRVALRRDAPERPEGLTLRRPRSRIWNNRNGQTNKRAHVALPSPVVETRAPDFFSTSTRRTTSWSSGSGRGTAARSTLFSTAILTVSLGVTSLVAYAYGCEDGRISQTRCALIVGALGARCSSRRACSRPPAGAC